MVEFVSFSHQLDITTLGLEKIEVSTLTREELQAEISSRFEARDITQW